MKTPARSQRVYDTLAAHGPLTIAQLARMTDSPLLAVKSLCGDMKLRGILIAVGQTFGEYQRPVSILDIAPGAARPGSDGRLLAPAGAAPSLYQRIYDAFSAHGEMDVFALDGHIGSGDIALLASTCSKLRGRGIVRHVERMARPGKNPIWIWGLVPGAERPSFRQQPIEPPRVAVSQPIEPQPGGVSTPEVFRCIRVDGRELLVVWDGTRGAAA